MRFEAKKVEALSIDFFLFQIIAAEISIFTSIVLGSSISHEIKNPKDCPKPFPWSIDIEPEICRKLNTRWIKCFANQELL